MKWKPRWDVETAVEKIIEWSLIYFDSGDVSECMQRQIREFLNVKNQNYTGWFHMKSKQWIRKILEFLHIYFSDKMIDALLQFIKFGIVGLSNTLISYVINVVILAIMSPFNIAWDFVAGNLAAFLLSVLWSFYWNNRFVFTAKEGEKRPIWGALLKAYISYGFTGIILNNILSWLWITKMGISKFIAPLINLIISVPLNFVINKFWTFKTK